MASREDILRALRRNRPGAAPLPEVPLFAPDGDVDLRAAFGEVLKAVGGNLIAVPGKDALDTALREAYPDCRQIACTVPGLKTGNVDLQAVQDPHTLHAVELAVIPSALGVAENAAVWLRESDLVHRALPFITQHLAIALPADALVPTLHQAYQRIRADEQAYGLWLAGPSKTADIEQSLVIGAHGARSLTVLLYGKSGDE